MPRLSRAAERGAPIDDVAAAQSVGAALAPARASTGGRRAVIGRESLSDLGRVLRGLRLEHGLTQSDVAGSDLTKALVSQIELGRTRPSAETLELIACRLGTSADRVLASLPSRRAPLGPSDAAAGLRRVEALIAVGRLEEATTELAALRTAPATAASLARLEAELLFAKGDHAGAVGRATEAIVLADQARDAGESVLAANVAGRAHFHAGRFAAALQYFDTALAHLDRVERRDPRLAARLLANRGNAHWRLGDAARAHDDFELALRRSEDGEDLRQLAIAHMGLGEMARDGGDLATASHHIERAIALFERLEERLLLVQNLHNLGETTAAMGDARAARNLHERALEAARAIRDDRTAGYALERLGALDVAQGAVTAAVGRAREAVDLARAGTDDHLLSQALATLGDALEAEGDHGAADAAYMESVSAAERDGAYSHRRALLRRGELERGRGDVRAAAATFESAALLVAGR